MKNEASARIAPFLIQETVNVFWRVDRPAAVLMLPYAAWVCFAAILNFTGWRLN